ncbi:MULTISPECIES: biotin--[acetyl-CoA-carboxylase] ligase [Helicobacter]|uniref:Biotin--[acetyl-CoA-carboxylase] ligase n=3 Tax=Helicobacter typhlonius TaxID=76936 RepID=A0A4U8S1C4_9HELI|nr:MULTISPECIES: biotin--[acetyl-CoA-carboxylase] ligase [Helicobacter]TLD79468.1 biotin--[acetyl-CoA-carboxylase] ligase [Helicobacter typhlonius]TLD86641.1 biotin--[acetyl-CoA-carboxylase] ligase [Helicobacter sp. MIT 03-1616]HCD72794.1 biotin--[acetyl-CoA-carboxylase] ligase [Helicobacter sp.]
MLDSHLTGFDSAFIALLNSRIYHFDTLESTQTYAIEMIKEDKLNVPFCISAKTQSNAIGSRGNQWDSVPKSLLFSFALPLKSLPQDLRLESSSIFFGVIMREYLRSLGSQVWLKYPNDLYRTDSKIGGILTQKVKGNIVCGIGINLYSANTEQNTQYATLEETISANIEPVRFLEDFFKSFENFVSWKQIFSIYKLEFYKNSSFFFHLGKERMCLKDAILNEDGSLSIDGNKIYSLR